MPALKRAGRSRQAGARYPSGQLKAAVDRRRRGDLRAQTAQQPHRRGSTHQIRVTLIGRLVDTLVPKPAPGLGYLPPLVGIYGFTGTELNVVAELYARDHARYQAAM